MKEKLFSPLVAVFVLVFSLCLAVLTENASAQQCNVQSNSSVQASQAAALQNQALQSVLQAQQLSQLQSGTSAVAVAGAPQRVAVAPVQRVQVQAPQVLQLAPAPASTSASAVATVPAPTQQLALVPVAAAQPQLLACRPKLFGGRARTTTSRSVAVTRTRG